MRESDGVAPLHVNVVLCGITYFELDAFYSYRLIRSRTEISVGIDHMSVNKVLHEVKWRSKNLSTNYSSFFIRENNREKKIAIYWAL